MAVRVEAVRGNVVQDRTERAPQLRAVLQTFGFIGDDSTRGDARGEIAIFFYKFGRQAAGLFGSHARKFARLR